MSTVDDPIPKNAIMWFDWGSSKNAMAPNVTKYATYLCAGVIDVGLVPGQLFIDPYSGQPVCYVTMIYSLGTWTPLSFIIVNNFCDLHTLIYMFVD